MFTFQVNLRNVCDNIPDVARTGALDHKERPTERRRHGYKKSVTVDLQALMMEKYLRELFYCSERLQARWKVKRKIICRRF